MSYPKTFANHCKLRGEHHFHHYSDDPNDLAFRAQKTQDHPWDPNASTYYSEDSQENDGSEPCTKRGPKLRKKKTTSACKFCKRQEHVG